MFNLYYHGGSKNHGCEAIVRGTVKILNDRPKLWSFNPSFDHEYALDEIVDINYDETVANATPLQDLFIKLEAKLLKKEQNYYKYHRSNFFGNISKNDVYLSIGGDNYCYSGNEILGYYNNLLHKKGAKTVLWGCSFEPSDLDDRLAKDLARYDAIFARESLSFEVLSKVNKNTFLFPDPAFQLDKVDLPLPKEFIESNTVGVNVSPLIMKSEGVEGITVSNYKNLLDYIITKTDMNVALIAHVVEEGNDDREPLKYLYDQYKDSGRVCMIDDCNCMELKGYISRCRFFIGARTHATIAAYSTCVPTLVVGYSIKAKGIAKDIFGTYDNYVKPVQSLKEENNLKEAFIWLKDNETDIKDRLTSFMPEYRAKSLEAGEKIRSLFVD